MSSTGSKQQATSKKNDRKAVDSKLIQRLYVFLKPYNKYLVVALILTLITAYLGPLRPYLTQIAVDDYIAVNDTQGLLRIVILFGFVLIGEFILLVFATYLTRWIGQGALNTLRTTVYAKIQHLHVQFFDKNPIGRLITRTTSDIEALSELLSSGVINIVGDIFRIGFILFFMFSLNWELSLVSLLTLPLLIYATIIFKRLVRIAFLNVRDQIAQLNSFVQEHINGMSIVQIFGQQTREKKRFDEINKAHTDAHIKTVFYFSVFWPIVEMLSSVAMALVIWYGGAKALGDALTFGVLLAFIQYVRLFFMPIRDLSDKFNTLQSALASSERIFDILDTENKIKDHEHPVPIGRPKGKIEFRNVWFRYGENEDYVLKNVSFTLMPGQSMAVVGATGAGKTTIINLVTRFYDIQKGQILIDDVDIKNISLHELRSSFGLVLQENALFSGSILQNITLGNEQIERDYVEEVIKMIEADGFINKLPGKLDYVLHERGASLSMGQRQLICFVRALVYDPAIIILDEATSSVDTETEVLVTNALRKLLKDRTSFIVAHRLSTIQHADVILVMHKGEIRESGRHMDLLEITNGIYRKLYELQYKDQSVVAT
ncbi:MAG: ABC transporter ATP-binding protein [Bacteroidetes bacterium]|nr:ABC transporter ATP-binding protein [Bacteroidota bacterium]MCH8522955.1 ABC transporter ATP-binding protein/permease [Balneolales bacterium]